MGNEVHMVTIPKKVAEALEYKSKIEVFGTYLKSLRSAKKISQSAMESKTGISHKTMYGYEYGLTLPQPDTIRKLSQALGCTHIGMMIKAGHVTEQEVFGFIRESEVPHGSL